MQLASSFCLECLELEPSSYDSKDGEAEMKKEAEFFFFLIN